MITTLTPNPSLDRTVALPGPLQRGGVNRLVSVTVEPGGKGLNVARVLAACGAEVTAVLPSPPGDPLLAAIESAALPGAGSVTTRAVSVAGAVRVNTAVTEPDGTTTKLNEPGAGLTAAETAAVEDALLAAVRASTTDTARPWAVLSGSLPPGAPTDWYARLVRLLRRAAPGVRIAVDTSDAPLAALATALPGAALDLIKPNGEELGQLAGLPAERAMALEQGALAGDLAPVVDAARVLVGAGISAVMATLGPAGAVLVTDEAAWHATAPDIAVRSTVGAGDSAVAGYVLADTRGEDAPGRLATAMAYGSAAAALPGTRLPTPQDLPTTAAVVTRLE
ncbi:MULTISPECIES: 1-phosphofructokinase family hexose kinase [unclassified Actinomyces]|uniref:1-phosphofructokinase family hexose kinase n=2 Tax=Actinomyces TaxID=1654 RepID=UPI002017AA23|nr:MULTISPECIES: 1-phosphofructokinase family hexose kinase [unclassified Actinomyces]MCL3777753.1 1-phosphofructokinase family hexose kinase [Actinomyces sp. AC-20-1]MCL3790958.1 1-phosphofructokinase family hexose kinase [Actinomyces sp. 187325]MCL3791788.1 1-phosphofructokinase family hexose kinase [Actinomyces sp. 186855]MCL3794927.1 1-phosphofructokinase family hexose kinase [Actinomyces sp. 217892]